MFDGSATRARYSASGTSRGWLTPRKLSKARSEATSGIQPPEIQYVVSSLSIALVRSPTRPGALAGSKATGATSGLIVTWVDPRGPAAGALHPGDVIEAVNGGAISTTDDWDVQTARLGADQTLVIGVRGSSGRRDVPVVGSAMPAADPASLGLTLRSLPGIGAEVVRVDPGSAGDRSGLLAGDVISRVDSTDAPTPAQVRQAFASPRERPLFIAFTRGTTHQVTALDRPTAKPEPSK